LSCASWRQQKLPNADLQQFSCMLNVATRATFSELAFLNNFFKKN